MRFTSEWEWECTLRMLCNMSNIQVKKHLICIIQSNQIQRSLIFNCLHATHILLYKWAFLITAVICVAFRCNVVEFDVKRTFKTICFERPACRNVNYQCHYQTTITDNTRLLRWYCKWRALQQVVAIQFDFACFFVCIFFRLLCTFQTFKHETVNSAIKIHRRAHRNSTFGFIIRFKLLYSHTHLQT